LFGKEFQQHWPSARPADGLAHCFGAFSETFEIAVLKLDPSAVAFGRKQDLDLGDEVRVEFEIRSQLPDQDQA